MRGMRCVSLGVVLWTSAAFAGTIENGVLMVEGKPFYPLGSWNSEYTSPEDIAALGMNTSFRGGPSNDAAVEQFRQFMRRCRELGIQVVPYLSYGGGAVEPWAPDAVRCIAKLATEPNLLAWYVGDDIGMPHLPGIRQTVSILREQTPTLPTVADYIARETPEAKTTFTQYVDIRCQYTYPIPDDPFKDYLAFFDKQREFVGDPLWTWVQSFMWGSTGRSLNVGAEGPGPVPDPEQVRLLSFAAINRGVRGLLFFPHHELHRLPELAAEVARVCHEIRLVSDHLAAGTPTFNLPVSDADLNATAFRCEASTVVSVALFKPFYHRWVDEGILGNVTVDCPWSNDDLPQALLASPPHAVACGVVRGPQPGMVQITVPRLDLSGFILLSSDSQELAEFCAGVAEIPRALRKLVVPAAAAQTRKVCGVVWQLGHDNLYAPSVVMDAMRANERCVDALDQGDYGAAYLAWRDVFRACRVMLNEEMGFAEARRAVLPTRYHRFLKVPYGLHNIKGLGSAPAADDPWRFVYAWQLAGPFPLEWDGKQGQSPPPGFERSYPPETALAPDAAFDTADGESGWQRATADASGLLNLREHFNTTENMVCYAQCHVIAPRDMEVRLSLGSNDGARVRVNGEVVFSWCGALTGGRLAKPHQNEIPVTLKAGRNVILVKVENLGNEWQLYLSVHDPSRELGIP